MRLRQTKRVVRPHDILQEEEEAVHLDPIRHTMDHRVRHHTTCRVGITEVLGTVLHHLITGKEAALVRIHLEEA